MKEKYIANRGLSEEAYKLIDKEIAKYPPTQKKSAVIAALAIAQREHGFVNQGLEKEIAGYLEMEEISVHEILTFYNMFNKKGTGKYKISVCTNLPCALRNSCYTVDFLKELLGIEVGVNLLNASIVISLMALPLIVSISEDALRAVPDPHREAALALGAIRWEDVYRVLFPAV